MSEMSDEFAPGDRSPSDLWTAFMEWLARQGDVVGVQTTYEGGHKFAGTFVVDDEVVLLSWDAIPRTGRVPKEILDPYARWESELDRRAGIVDKWEEEP